MKHFTLPLLFTVLLTVAKAESELERLRMSYDRAVEKATQPLKATYEKELRSLLQRYAQAGRISEAEKVVAELKALGFKDIAPPRPVATETSVRPSMIENSKWKTPTGTTFAFYSDGKGERWFSGDDKTSFKWSAKGNGTCEVTGPGSKGEGNVVWHFRFVNPQEAYYGNTMDDVTKALQRLP